MEIVTLPWLDKSKLELWLQTPVEDCVSKDADLKGDNYLSDLHRLLVKTKNGDKSLIVKCRLEDGPAAVSLRESTIFKKEQEMYSITLPRMHELLRNAVPDILEPLAPNCLYSCKRFLVLEDLSYSGYKMLDRQKGLTFEQCLTVMRTIARFHAASIALHEQDPDSMKEYQHNFYSQFSKNGSWDICFQAMKKLIVEELETWPAPQWSPFVEKLRRIDMLEKANETSRTCDSDFNVLIHGDLWINNILFHDDNVMRMVDFQFVQFTSFAIDLQWFFVTSPKMDVRIKHTDTLIQEYHNTLCNAMSALGCRRKLITLEELYEEYHRKSFYGVFGLVCAASVMTADTNCGYDLDEAMKGITPGTGMLSDYFKQAVKWSFPLLGKMGAFDNK